MRLYADGDAEPGRRSGTTSSSTRAAARSCSRRVGEESSARAPPNTRTSGASQSLASSQEPEQSGTGIVAGETDRAVHRDDGQARRGQGPLDLRAAGGGHRRVDELAVDEPEFDTRITPAAAGCGGRPPGWRPGTQGC